MRRVRVLVCLVLALGALAPEVASAWSSNAFTSPTRNIRCRYVPSGGYLTCSSAALGRSVTLYFDGTTSRSWRVLPRRGPVLAYGESWDSVDGNGDLLHHCESAVTGVYCYVNTDQGYGWFHISRSGIRTGH